MEKYKKNSEISYTFGTFPTFELIKNKPQFVEKILIHDKLTISADVEKLLNLAKANNIFVEKASKQIEKISDKDNTLVVGVFKKYTQKIEPNTNHIVLVNPSDMGNLGTILRTSLGFNQLNIALISPCADHFNPKVIRSSMGAIFSLNVQVFSSFEEYHSQNSNHEFYPFMLKAKTTLQTLNRKKSTTPFALIFGNEATGLDDSFLSLGTPILITHSSKIDSLNLPISASIAMFEFNK